MEGNIMWCKICGGEIYPGIDNVGGSHADADYCVVILNARVEHEQARAEAAETDLRELRENTLLALGLNPVNVADGTEDATIAYLLSGLRERVQELEAQLAAMDDDEREDVRHRAIINDVFGDDAKWGCDE